MDVRAYWLWLVLVFGAGSPNIWLLSKDHQSVVDFVNALKNDEISNAEQYVKERVSKFELETAEEIIKDCESKGINVYCYESEGYPDKLREIANPPAVIFVKGSLDFLENNFLINVAGTRSPSDYSKRITSEICKGLCQNGCVIVSGMTDGTDTLASRSALEQGSVTLGICGFAIDVYDEKSDELIASIISHGALISETCSAMDVQRPKFSSRNRLITGLCDAVVFIEGSLISRGLDLCEHAIAQGRFLFVVPPHDITDKRYSGQSWLIRRGCMPLFSVQDVLYYIANISVDMLEYNTIAEDYSDLSDYSFFVGETPDGVSKPKNSGSKKKSKQAEGDLNDSEQENKENDFSSLEGLEKSICEMLKEKPMLADAIAVKLDEDISTILSKLTMLELEGYVVSLPGKQFGLI